MEAEDDTHYYVILPFVMNTMIKYHYQRESSIVAGEYLSTGRTVRYRLFHVEGPSIIQDIICQWEATKLSDTGGRFSGYVFDAINGEPLPSIMISIAGHQVFTLEDGSFSVENLSSGIHNFVAMSLDGKYLPHQQGVNIQPGVATYGDVTLQPSSLVKVTFRIKTPENSPTNIPIRLAGNLSQFGNSFVDLQGGITSLISRMPTLSLQSDGFYSLQLNLPVGFDFRYKYTLGDGYINAEQTLAGDFRLRQLIVPDSDTNINDAIDSWENGTDGRINFNTRVTATNAISSMVYLQLDLGHGWMEPLPMWGQLDQQESTLWSYTVYPPKGSVNTIHYRFCAEQDCENTHILERNGSPFTNGIVEVGQEKQTINTEITAWRWDLHYSDSILVPNTGINPKGASFSAGIALLADYHPARNNLYKNAISEIKSLHANLVVFQPSWRITGINPFSLGFSPDSSPHPQDLEGWVDHAHKLDLNTAIFPHVDVNSLELYDLVLQTDKVEYRTWLDAYYNMVRHYALLAGKSNVGTLVIYDDWINQIINTGTVQIIDEIDNGLWSDFVVQLRQSYPGKIAWAISYPGETIPPVSFLAGFDEIYVIWSISSSLDITLPNQQLRNELLRLVDQEFAPIWNETKQPLVLGIRCPSSDLSDQMDVYNAVMMTVNQRDWLRGVISMDYYPLLPILDDTSSVNGKPASGVLWYWFPRFLTP